MKLWPVREKRTEIPSQESPTNLYFVRLNGKEHGPYPAAMLHRLKGFVLQTPTRKEHTDVWEPAYRVIDLSAYYAPPKHVAPVVQAEAMTQIRDLLIDTRPHVYRAGVHTRSPRVLLILLLSLTSLLATPMIQTVSLKTKVKVDRIVRAYYNEHSFSRWTHDLPRSPVFHRLYRLPFTKR